jgi:shikimate kinase
MEKVIVLVGLMGSGKTRVGAELAKLMKVPFIDSDREIEKSAGMSVQEIFDRLGEQAFRDGEKKVIARLLNEQGAVMATGGGAFMQAEVRQIIREKGISVWLKANLQTLVERTSRTDNRPLLRGEDRAEKLQKLMDERYDTYAEADITIITDGQNPQASAQEITEAITRYYDRQQGARR